MSNKKKTKNKAENPETRVSYNPQVIRKPLPKFKSEEEEVEFFEKNDLGDYYDFSKAQKVTLPNLKPSTESISLRLPVSLLDQLKVLANRSDVPYQSLIKLFLQEKVLEEFKKSA
ncbi:MAG TPA: BrnA antitoxin family protein [Ignavibacteriales bacterium]|nr:BrnA antitoxin family protein [Ignavibacteriales bacterium]